MKRNLLFILMFLFIAYTLSAQIEKTSPEDYLLLKEISDQSPLAPEPPRFLLKDKNNRYMMGIGGYVKSIYGWDISNVMDDIDFIPAIIPVPAQMGNKADYFSDPLRSALTFNMISLPHSPHQISVYIRIAFNGKNTAVIIKNVYVKYRHFTLGRDRSIFNDSKSKPETIDPQGPNGSATGTAYILNYERKWKNGLGIGISLEQPTFDEYAGRYEGSDHPELKGTQFYDDASQPIPDIPAYIEYTGKNDNRIKLAGIIRNFFYIDNKAPNTRSICGWGVQLCGNFNPAKPLTVYYQALYGKGVANYINDLNGRKVSYIPQNDKPGKMTPAPMLGWFAAVNYELPNKLKLGYIYSEARIWKTSTYNPDYKYGQYMAANAFYPVREYLVLGAEWLWGKHQTFIHESGTINRVQAMIKIAF